MSRGFFRCPPSSSAVTGISDVLPSLEAGGDSDPSDHPDPWAHLADSFADEAYATPKGRVRTYVLHHQLLAHLPPAPATVLDVGGGAGHQSFPLARAGYEVTLLDPSEAMLAKARRRLSAEPASVRSRVSLLAGAGEDASSVVGDRLFDVVCCHGVLMYQPSPSALVAALCRRVAPGGVLSVMALNARTMALRPALERRWADVLAALPARATGSGVAARSETGVLGVDTRADTVEELSGLLTSGGLKPLDWYGVWLFSDLVDLAGAGEAEVAELAEAELRASRTDPYRQMSRVFHLLGRARTT